MSDKEKKFPAPHARTKPDPYRQAAPPAPSAPLDVALAPVPSKKPLDVFEELERVEVDPRVIEEVRSSNRMWGGAMIVVGLVMFAGGVAMDCATPSTHVYRSTTFTLFPMLGLIIFASGIRRWNSRDLDL